MEQFIGCDAYKKFSAFVAVNEKGQAGEALRAMHDRQLYREFLGRLPAHSAIAVEASRRAVSRRFRPPLGNTKLGRAPVSSDTIKSVQSQGGLCRSD
jgi:hypothetical protein